MEMRNPLIEKAGNRRGLPQPHEIDFIVENGYVKVDYRCEYTTMRAKKQIITILQLANHETVESYRACFRRLE